MSDVRRLLDAANRGDHQAAADLLPLVYAELHKLAAVRLAQEKPGQTLTATALVHEAYLRLIAPTADAPSPPRFDGTGHFFAAAAEAIRRILVENVRRKRSAKHGGGLRREDLPSDLVAAPMPDDELLAVNEALDRLAEKHPEKADLVRLRYFAGLSGDEAAAALGISASSGDCRWRYARAWLAREIIQMNTR